MLLLRLRSLRSRKTWQKGETVVLDYWGNLAALKMAKEEAPTDQGIRVEAIPLVYDQCHMAQMDRRTLELAVEPLLQEVMPRRLEEKDLILAEEGKPLEEGLRLLEPLGIATGALQSQRTKRGQID